MGIEVFERHGASFATALRDYYAYARDHDLYLCYVIVNPQGDRSKAWGEQSSEEMTMRVVDEDSGGVTVRGAKMLGTGSVMAEEILVANLQPLKPGEERFAISFALPLGCPRHQGSLAQELRGERGQPLGQPALPPLRRERFRSSISTT